MSPVGHGVQTQALADARILEISRRLKAPRALVFKVFTDPAHLVRWFGPEGFAVSACRVNAKVGGEFYVHMVSPEGNDYRVSGTFTEIEVPEYLAFSWAWLDDAQQRGFETLITLAFQKDGDETELFLRQERFEDAGACAAHLQGWLSCLGCLERYLADQQ